MELSPAAVSCNRPGQSRRCIVPLIDQTHFPAETFLIDDSRHKFAIPSVLTKGSRMAVMVKDVDFSFRFYDKRRGRITALGKVILSQVKTAAVRDVLDIKPWLILTGPIFEDAVP